MVQKQADGSSISMSSYEDTLNAPIDSPDLVPQLD